MPRLIQAWRWLFILMIAGFSPEAAIHGADLEIDRDTELDPQQMYGKIVIKASNITLNGRGAWLVGSANKDATTFQDVAIAADGFSNVTIKNLNAKGWETGLFIANGTGWTIEGCNFSDNFHNPKFGWGENGRRGGIVLHRISNSRLLRNHANRVWDGCVLVDCDDNLLEENDFSHTSNTCLKLWHSCRNTVRQNNLSYGIRIDPGEVHARDSTCVLMESGSNDNRLLSNDCTHGGDGIFVRVLNQWVSTGNVFQENDCSHANNNCVEAWSPSNTWIKNKANHGSYGFWLGASDKNVLIGNEASFNGLPDGFHNSPHLPDNGHAGIVFMFGPSSHTLLRGNLCEGNHGAGIAAIGDLESKGKKWNAFHWIIEQNELKSNRWGIYLQHAEMIDLAANRFINNSVRDIFQAENVTAVESRTVDTNLEITQPPVAVLVGPQVVKVGEKVTFDATDSRDPEHRPLSFRWRLPGRAIGKEPKLVYHFEQPGYYRLALTVDNGVLSHLAWRDLYVIEGVSELATEEGLENWSWHDPGSRVKFSADRDTRLVGQLALRANIDPYSGGRVTLRYSIPTTNTVPLANKTHFSFWLKTRNESVPAWQDLNPLIDLIGPDGEKFRLEPARDFLGDPPYNEARDGWTYFSIPLAGDANWKCVGVKPAMATELHFGFDSWNAPPLVIWLDGIGFKSLAN